jgi:isochorismate hydrolase
MNILRTNEDFHRLTSELIDFLKERNLNELEVCSLMAIIAVTTIQTEGVLDSYKELLTDMWWDQVERGYKNEVHSGRAEQ